MAPVKIEVLYAGSFKRFQCCLSTKRNDVRLNGFLIRLLIFYVDGYCVLVWQDATTFAAEISTTS